MSYKIGKVLKMKKSGKKISKAEKQLTKSKLTLNRNLNTEVFFLDLIKKNPQLEVLFTKKNQGIK
tara:strand:- start:5436 stop:5630 length:195 start_codon:yes stop_codon:yes gene_type:complete